ncbi:MAG TPA: hypothetical protein CFH81_08755 [Sulfurovum sp. UBA12169]|nr:MAG TPA: hypothetical protein CFH81_08755 [Sulfurovum sp. UBA12169]
MSKSQYDINALADIDTERSLLRALMEFDTDETVMALVKLKEQHFFDENHGRIFACLKELESRGYNLEPQTVHAELMREHTLLVETLKLIMLSEPVAAVLFAVDALEEWSKKRELHRGFLLGLQGLHGGDSSLLCANSIAKVADEVSISSVDSFTSYAALKAKIEKEPPVPKIPTGIPLIDVKLKGGIEYGQLIGIMGDPEAGKTVIMTQILKHISSMGHETLFFNFEFHYRSFVEQNRLNEDRFSVEKFLMEMDNNDILDLEAKIKIFAKRGGRVVGIDSQMMITNIRNNGTSSERETEKFFLLQRLAIKYGLIIMLIAQQGKEDSRSSTVTPMGSKNAAHALHQIWYIKKPKLEFDDDGNDERKGSREIVCYKNKQTGVHFSKPIQLDPRRLEFRGVQFDEDDHRSNRSVGSGRPKKNADEFDVQYVEYVMEDAKGVQTGFDPSQLDMPLL